MRKIEKNMLYAVKNCENMSESNTTVKVSNGVIRVYLHGNEIYKIIGGKCFFTLSGYNTNVTRSRLNALGVNVRQKNFEPVFNGVTISSCKWYEV